MTTPGQPDGKNADLQVLRGVSILLVLLQHLSLSITAFKDLAPTRHFPGWLGVEVFFVISGYVIINALARDRYEPISFLTRRVWRLTPALLVFVAFCAALNAVLAGADLNDWARQTFVLEWRDFRKQMTATVLGFFTLQPRYGYVTGAVWSLSVEDQFYAGLAAVALAGAVVLRARAPRAIPWAVGALAAGVYLTLLAARLDLYFGSGTVLAGLPRPWPYLFHWKFDFLALGILTAYLDRAIKGPLRSVVAGRGWLAAPVLLVVPLVLAMGSNAMLGEPRLVGLVLVIAGLCFAGLVLVAANDPILPRSGRWLYAPLQYLGDRSYTYYLMHFPVLAVVWFLLVRYRPELTGEAYKYGFWQAVGLVVLMVPLVELIYQGVEKPLTAVGRRLAKRVRIIPAAAGPAPERPATSEPAPTRLAA
jgi:peptidoglycan/LPS O-acetylase OafA/YrhL